MIKDSKYKTLVYRNGLRRAPSGVISGDDELSECCGMYWRDGEWHVVQMPEDVGVWTADLKFVHDYGEYTHLLGVRNGHLLWVDYQDTGDAVTLGAEVDLGQLEGELLSVSAIGNTLILSTSVGLRYWLWTRGNYKYIGSVLPEINFDCRMEPALELRDNALLKPEVEGRAIVTDFVTLDRDHIKVLANHVEDFRNAVIGHISSVRNQMKRKGYFCFPFWLRLSWRLYDGSHIMTTVPVLMLPSVRRNNLIRGHQNKWVDLSGVHTCFQYKIEASRLVLSIKNTHLEDWSDIISGVDVFVSEETLPFDVDGEWIPYHISEKTGETVVDCVRYYGEASLIHPVGNSYEHNTLVSEGYDIWGGSTDAYQYVIMPETFLTDEQIINALLSKSTFYELLSLNINDIDNTYRAVESRIEKNALLNLTTRLQLERDDYYNHCRLKAGNVVAYNGRLNLCDVWRGFWEGGRKFLPYYDTRTSGGDRLYPTPVKIYTHIRTDSGEHWILNDTNLLESTGYWYYYPDPRAFEVVFVTGGVGRRYKLREHPGLNGAYMLDCLPSDISASGGESYDISTLPGEGDLSNNSYECLRGYTLTSEADNPFLFPATGYNRIGSGVVMAISTTTDALSEGQFGSYPLLAFTTEGVWAMAVGSDGRYVSTDPISREVCVDGKSVVQTDGAVFFASSRGLMQVTGRTVKNISELLRGKVEDLSEFGGVTGVDFLEYFSGMRIAYDYPQGLLWIYNPSYDWCWLYSLKTGVWSQKILPARWITDCVLYPDGLVQTSGNRLLSFAHRPLESSDAAEYNCRMLTRPLSFGSILYYKSILELEHHMMLSGNLIIKIWGSENLHEWYLLRGFHGRPWRYYRVLYAFEGLRAADVYCGSTWSYVNRHIGRLHPESAYGDIDRYEEAYAEEWEKMQEDD